MIDLFADKPQVDLGAIARVKGWVVEELGLPPGAAVMVTELRCAEDDCPDVETVIAVLGGPEPARPHKVLKPVAEVIRDDVRGLAARAPASAGPGG